MKEKLFLHITKRSEHVLQWSKANFFTFFLASFFNATRKKLVTLDFYIFPGFKEKEHMEFESIHSIKSSHLTKVYKSFLRILQVSVKLTLHVPSPAIL